jgi:hypothetical protein
MFFELGLAIGLGKRIFVVAGESPQMPADLRSISYVISDEWNPRVIEPHLDAFLSTLPSKRPPKESKKGTQVARTDFNVERRRLANFSPNTTERELIIFVEELFRKASISVISSPIEDFGADFAILSPAIKRHFRNPILVEIKHSTQLSDPVFVLKRLNKLVESGRGSAALLLFLVSESKSAAIGVLSDSKTRQPVLILTVKELIDILEKGSLITEISNASF